MILTDLGIVLLIVGGVFVGSSHVHAWSYGRTSNLGVVNWLIAWTRRIGAPMVVVGLLMVAIGWLVGVIW